MFQMVAKWRSFKEPCLTHGPSGYLFTWPNKTQIPMEGAPFPKEKTRSRRKVVKPGFLSRNRTLSQAWPPNGLAIHETTNLMIGVY